MPGNKTKEELGYELIAAAKAGEQDQVIELIAQGANIDYIDEHGKSAIYYAFVAGHFEIVDFLHAKGADTDISITQKTREKFAEAEEYADLGVKAAVDNLEFIYALRFNITIKSVSFDKCKFSDLEAKLIAEVLKHNRSLRFLDLSHNNIGVTGAVAIASALISNQTLLILNLKNNPLGEIGVFYIANALKLNTTLHSLRIADDMSEGQHICEALAVNTGLQLLEFNFKYNNKYAEQFTIALSQNTTLQEISIDTSNYDYDEYDDKDEVESIYTPFLSYDDNALYCFGSHTRDNYDKTLDLAKQGDRDAEWRMVLRYADDNKAKAIEYLTLAADHGHYAAMASLETLLRTGLCKIDISTSLYTKIDLARADYYYEQLTQIERPLVQTKEQQLLIAAAIGDLTQIQALVQAGVNIDYTDYQFKHPALVMAFAAGHLDAFQYLYELKARLPVYQARDLGGLGSYLALLENQGSVTLTRQPSYTDDYDIDQSANRHELKLINFVLKINSSVRMVNLSGNKLGNAEMGMVADVIQHNRTIKEYNLADNDFDLDGLTQLIDGFKVNPAVRIINLRGNKIDNAGIKLIAEFIASSSNIVKIDLACNDFDLVGLESLIAGLSANKSLRSIHLNANKIDNAGIKLIADFLAKNANIVEVDLSGNDFDLDGLRYLTDQLKLNQSIKRLNLGFFQYDLAGVKYLTELIAANPNIEALSLRGAKFDLASLKYLTEDLIHNHSLRALDLSHDNYDCLGAEEMQVISHLIANNHFIEELNLSENYKGHLGARYVVAALMHNKSLKKLNLWHNGYSGADIPVTLKALANHASLQSINLGDSAVSDYLISDARNIAQALTKNHIILRADIFCDALDVSIKNPPYAIKELIIAKLKDNLARAIKLADSGDADAALRLAFYYAEELAEDKVIAYLTKAATTNVSALSKAEILYSTGIVYIAGNVFTAEIDLVKAAVYKEKRLALTANVSVIETTDIITLPAYDNDELSQALISAAEAGELEQVKNLLVQGADINYEDPETSKSVIETAFLAEQIAVVDYLFAQGAEGLSKCRIRSFLRLVEDQDDGVIEWKYGDIGHKYLFSADNVKDLSLFSRQCESITSVYSCIKNLDIEAIGHIALLLNNNPNLLAFSLYNAIDNDGIKLIADTLATNHMLQHIGLDGRLDIDVEGLASLVASLKINTTLTSLALSDNNFGYDEALLIADLISSNNSLTTIELRGNDFADEARELIIEAILINPSLLKIDGLGEDERVREKLASNLANLIIVADGGDAVAQRKLALHYGSGDEKILADRYIKLAAKNGDIVALRIAETIYHTGEVVINCFITGAEIDLNQARHYRQQRLTAMGDFNALAKYYKFDLENRLILAAGEGKLEEVKSLLAQGAYINYLDPYYHKSAIFFAFVNLHMDVVDYLYQQGANIMINIPIMMQHDLEFYYLNNKAGVLCSDNRIDKAEFCLALKVDTTLSCLDEWNVISFQSVMFTSSFLRTNQELLKVQLFGKETGNQYFIEALTVNKTLRELSLTIPSKHYEYLADFIKTNETLTELYLRWRESEDKQNSLAAAKVFAEALKANQNLQSIDIYWQCHDAETARMVTEYFAEAIRESKYAQKISFRYNIFEPEISKELSHDGSDIDETEQEERPDFYHIITDAILANAYLLPYEDENQLPEVTAKLQTNLDNLIKRAEGGDADAAWRLATYYAKPPRDERLALNYLNQALEAKQPQAVKAAIKLFQTGKGRAAGLGRLLVIPDPSLAAKYEQMLITEAKKPSAHKVVNAVTLSSNNAHELAEISQQNAAMQQTLMSLQQKVLTLESSSSSFTTEEQQKLKTILASDIKERELDQNEIEEVFTQTEIAEIKRLTEAAIMQQIVSIQQQVSLMQQDDVLEGEDWRQVQDMRKLIKEHPKLAKFNEDLQYALNAVFISARLIDTTNLSREQFAKASGIGSMLSASNSILASLADSINGGAFLHNIFNIGLEGVLDKKFKKYWSKIVLLLPASVTQDGLLIEAVSRKFTIALQADILNDVPDKEAKGFSYINKEFNDFIHSVIGKAVIVSQLKSNLDVEASQDAHGMFYEIFSAETDVISALTLPLAKRDFMYECAVVSRGKRKQSVTLHEAEFKPLVVEPRKQTVALKPTLPNLLQEIQMRGKQDGEEVFVEQGSNTRQVVGTTIVTERGNDDTKLVSEERKKLQAEQRKHIGNMALALRNRKLAIIDYTDKIDAALIEQNGKSQVKKPVFFSNLIRLELSAIFCKCKIVIDELAGNNSIFYERNITAIFDKTEISQLSDFFYNTFIKTIGSFDADHITAALSVITNQIAELYKTQIEQLNLDQLKALSRVMVGNIIEGVLYKNQAVDIGEMVELGSFKLVAKLIEPTAEIQTAINLITTTGVKLEGGKDSGAIFLKNGMKEIGEFGIRTVPSDRWDALKLERLGLQFVRKEQKTQLVESDEVEAKDDPLVLKPRESRDSFTSKIQTEVQKQVAQARLEFELAQAQAREDSKQKEAEREQQLKALQEQFLQQAANNNHTNKVDSSRNNPPPKNCCLIS